MATAKYEEHYTCWNDCEMSGCPGHTASIEYQSVSDALKFDDGKGQTFYIQTPELEAFAKMLRKLMYRGEIERALKPLLKDDDEGDEEQYRLSKKLEGSI